MFNEKGLDAQIVLEQLQKILEADSTYSSGHPIASMSTIPHPLGVEVFSRTLEKNAGRLHTFEGSAQIEQDVIRMLGDLLNLRSPFGTTTSGGTESNILAMLSARESSKERGKKPEVIAPENAHSSIDKAAWLLGVKLVRTKVDDEFKADIQAIKKTINNNTIGIFATAGTTYLGQVDPIPEMGEIAEEHEIFMHVDAAFGGFVIPFLKDLGLFKGNFDFSVPGVSSISVDPHKMGLAPIPAGSVVFRDGEQLKKITSKVPYLRGASATQASILGTRPAASILSTWAIMKNLGRNGYRKIIEDCMKRTFFARERVKQSQMLDITIEPVMNILGITSKVRPIDQIVEDMEKRGWRMATSPLPPTIRLVIMPHVDQGAMNALFNDLEYIASTIPAN